MPPAGFDNLKHLVVLMMENRSFDHMLGGLHDTDPRIDGLAGTETNPDTGRDAAQGRVQGASTRASSIRIPNHDFAPVDQQIFNGGAVARHAGVRQQLLRAARDVEHSRQIMYYFKPDKLPVLTTLAQEFAVFNRWFSSIPGPTLCNRAFAHYGTSFGHVGMEIFYANAKFKSIYQRLEDGGRTAKIYLLRSGQLDDGGRESAPAPAAVLRHLRRSFCDDCASGQLPDYSFVEPNYSDHDGRPAAAHRLRPASRPSCSSKASGSSRPSTTRSGTTRRSGRAPRCSSPTTSTAASTIMSPPPACMPDGFVAQPDATKTGQPFHVRPPRRARAGGARLAVGAEGYGRRTSRAYSSTRRFPPPSRSGCCRTSPRTSARPGRPPPKPFSIC